MNPDYNKIFTQSLCLTNTEMIEYVSGNLSENDKRRIEIHIADCEMCNDELEGLSNMKNVNDLPLIVSMLNEDIDSVIKKDKFVIAASSSKKYNFKRIFSVAASIALLITIGFVINNFADKSSENLAQAEAPVESVAEESELMLREEGVDELIVTKELKSIEQNVSDNQSQLAVESFEIVEDRSVIPEEFIFEEDGESNDYADFEFDEVEEIVVSENETTDMISPTIADDFSDKRKEESVGSDYEVVDVVSTKTEDETNKDFLGYTSRSLPSAKSENRKKASINYLSIRNSGLLSYDVKSYKEAAVEFDKYLVYKPEDYEIVYKSGMSYYYQKKYTSAINRYNKIISGDINLYVEDAQWYKSMALINQGKEDEALKLLNQIVFKNGKYQKRALDAINHLEKN